MFLLATSIEADIQKEQVLDSLAIRTIQSKPGAGMIAWLRSNKWQERGDYANSLGVIAESTFFSEEKLYAALKKYSKFMSNTDLQNNLLSSSDERILTIVLKRYASDLSLVQKVKLLSHPSIVVREKVLPNIQTNDVGAMKLITAAYDKEASQKIKDVYKKQFWFIKK